MCGSACGLEAQRIEEMEKMLKEAQQEKARLIENRVSAWFQRHRVPALSGTNDHTSSHRFTRSQSYIRRSLSQFLGA